MPLGAARITLLAATTTVEAVAEVVRRKIGVSAQGSASISTDQSQFGGSSAEIQAGSTDYLQLSDASKFAFGNNDWTIEMWFRLDDTTGLAFLWDTRPTSTNGNYTTIYVNGSTLYYYRNGNQISTTVSAATWYHLAVVYESSTGDHKMYIDGTQVGSTYTASIAYTAGDAVIGYSSYNNNYSMDGFIDELRVSNTARYTGSFNPSPVPFKNDNNTLLLLHMDGTDLSTFFNDDNGDHNTTRTAVAVDAGNDATSDTSQYKFGDASLYLDGTDDYLEVGSSTFLDDFVNTSPWTIEYWIRPQSTSGFETHFGNWGGSSTRCFFLGSDNGSQLTFYWVDSGGTIDTTTIGKNSGALTVGSWNHVALTNDGTNYNLYSNGTRVASGSNDTIRAQAERTRIGASATNNEDFLGHIDEFRISTVERYSGTSYTQPTTRFINDSDTLLLLHFDGEKGTTTFTDDNTEGRSPIGMFASGNAQLDTAQSYFGGSSYLGDGTDDRIVSENSDTFTFHGDFTWECYARAQDLGNTNTTHILTNRGGFVGNAALHLLWRGFDEKIQWGTQSSGALLSNSALSYNTWYHLAIVRHNGVLKLYIDGTAQTSTHTTSDVVGSGNNNLITIGGLDNGSGTEFNGHIDEVRISNTARYTSNFTPDTTPFTNDSNTMLLVHMDGTDGDSDFIDDNGKTRSAIGIRAEGSGAVDTAQYKFGGSSFVADGTGDDNLAIDENAFDWTKINNHSQTDNYTLECWIRSTNVATTNAIFGTRTSTASHNWDLEIRTDNGNGTLRWFNGNSELYRSSGGVVSADTWHHIAVVVEGADLNVYVDGTAVITQTRTDSNTTGGSDFFIGKGGYPTLNKFYGNIDEFRLSDTARYTSNFTAPTEPFQNDGNTLLLIHMNGADGSTTFIDDNGYYE